MNEQRKESRMAQEVPAVITFCDGRNKPAILACIVMDQSKEGARVSLREPHVVPFEFHFATSGETPRKARKVWVKHSEMGLQFTG